MQKPQIATALSTAYHKQTGKRRVVGHWLSNKRAGEALEHLSSATGIPAFELYQAIQDSSDNGGGTWLHPMLANRFAVWLLDEYG